MSTRVVDSNRAEHRRLAAVAMVMMAVDMREQIHQV
jgi:hypothetical protein